MEKSNYKILSVKLQEYRLGLKLAVLIYCLSVTFVTAVSAQQNGFDVNDPRYNVFGQSVVSTDSTLSLPPVSILATERGDKTISLLIDENIHKNFYSSYYIERSTDGLNFTQLNQEPYYFVEPDSDDISSLDPLANDNLEVASNRSAVYRDVVEDNDTYYYYRIIGTNNLGQMSAPSPVVMEKAIPPKMDFIYHLDTLIYDSTTDNVVIHFPDYHDSIKTKLVGYQLYKSVFHDGPFDPLNTEIIPTTQTTYTDIDPYLSGYYIAVSWDEEGYEYRSFPYLTQLPDSIAPPVPVVQSAIYTEKEKVKITWDEVYASDLKGYYIYFANGKNGEYNPINSSPIQDTTLVHDFAVGMEIDSIYFKAASIDNRGNISDSSEPFGIRRPGKYGAADPVIHSITPYTGGNKGMVLAISFSPDKDIKYHKLERRSASNATWMEIKRIYHHEQVNYAQGPEQESYVDSTYIRSEELEYRLMVIDQDDLITSSEIINTFPLNNHAEGYINQLELELRSAPAPLPPLSQFQSPIAGQLPPQVNNTIMVSWVYDLTPRLEGFIIYRGVTGGHIVEYRTIPKKDLEMESVGGDKYKFKFGDSSLIGNKRYIYKVMAQHLDGSTSHMSNAVSIKID